MLSPMANLPLCNSGKFAFEMKVHNIVPGRDGLDTSLMLLESNDSTIERGFAYFASPFLR